MTLHDRIMKEADHHNIETDHGCGYVDGLTKCAQLAAKTDDLMAEMADILWSASIGCAVNNKAADAVEKYNAWKEGAK